MIVLNHLKGKKKVNKKDYYTIHTEVQENNKGEEKKSLKAGSRAMYSRKSSGVFHCVLYRQCMQFFLFIFRGDCIDSGFTEQRCFQGRQGKEYH